MRQPSDISYRKLNEATRLIFIEKKTKCNIIHKCQILMEGDNAYA